MKAYICSSAISDENYVSLVYAETANKAKLACDWSEIEAEYYTDIRVKRVPRLDNMENASDADRYIKALKEKIFSGFTVGDKIYCLEDINTPAGENEFRQALEAE